MIFGTQKRTSEHLFKCPLVLLRVLFMKLVYNLQIRYEMCRNSITTLLKYMLIYRREKTLAFRGTEALPPEGVHLNL